MLFFKKYIRMFSKSLLLALFLLAAEAFTDLMLPTLMSKLVDVGVMNKDLDYVIKTGLIMLLFTGVQMTFAIARNILACRVAQKAGALMRSDVFRKIQGFSHRNLDQFETSTLVTRMTNDITQVQNFLFGMMRIFVKAPLIGIGAVVMAVILNYKLSMILLIVVPVVGFLIYLSMKVGYPFFKKVQKKLDGLNGIVREYLSGVRVVKAFNRFNYEKRRFGQANQELTEVSITSARALAVFPPLITLALNLGVIAVLWFGGWMTENGSVQVGQVIAFINYMSQILFSLMMMSFVFNSFVRARASSERISEVMQVENEMPEADLEHKRMDANEDVGLTFENVTFSYKNNGNALEDISFCCRPGETLGIIGPTGSGKSTLVKLIGRFYDVGEGRILMNGTDIREIHTEDLRRLFAFVPQKTLLFTGTIEDNLRWGNEKAERVEIERVADIADAHRFISEFREGYETLLGQEGVNLSGGQKQRVAIARALMRRPKLLVLDDCTSALDMSTERRVRTRIKEFAESMTCIVIGQRITSVMDADKILVLDEGKMVGLGRHEELLETCQVYRDIYESQIGR